MGHIDRLVAAEAEIKIGDKIPKITTIKHFQLPLLLRLELLNPILTQATD